MGKRFPHLNRFRTQRELMRGGDGRGPIKRPGFMINADP